MLGLGKAAAIGCYGFLRNFAPNAQYFSSIVIGEKNFTVEQTTQEIYPVTVYSNLVLTVVVLLVTDLVKYKPVIIVGTMAGLMTMVLLNSGETLGDMQIMEVFYAMMKASNLASRTYIYTQIDKNSYQYMTAIVNIMPKAGFLISSLLAQVLLSLQLASLYNLVQIHIATMFLALIIAVFLPSVDHDKQNSKDMTSSTSDNFKTWLQYRQMVHRLQEELKVAFSKPYVIKWCLWWIASLGATYLVINYYVQALWSEVSGKTHNEYNAGVQALYTALTSGACYMIGRIEINWRKQGDIVLGLTTVIKGVALLGCAYTNSLTSAYVMYIIYRILFDVMLVVCSSEVALQLENGVFGLIFGVVTFLSLLLQSFLTFILTSKSALALPIRSQFIAIGLLFIATGTIYVAAALYRLASKWIHLRNKKVSDTETGTVWSTKYVGAQPPLHPESGMRALPDCS